MAQHFNEYLGEYEEVKTSHKRAYYLIYEVDSPYELPVFVGDIDEVCKFLGRTMNNVRSMMCKGKTFVLRYHRPHYVTKTYSSGEVRKCFEPYEYEHYKVIKVKD